LTETKGLKGNITLWEKDMLSGDKGFVYASYGLSCRNSKLLKTGQARSYSRDASKEIVTELMWQDNAEARTIGKMQNFTVQS